jgi:hypothetical protein
MEESGGIELLVEALDSRADLGSVGIDLGLDFGLESDRDLESGGSCFEAVFLINRPEESLGGGGCFGIR